MMANKDSETGPVVSDVILTSAFQELLRADRKIEQAKDERKALRRRLKSAGIQLGELDQAMKDRDGDPEEITRSIETRIRYANWLGAAVGTQAALFSEDMQASVKAQDRVNKAVAEQNGYDSGLVGALAEANPYPRASDLGDIWERSRRAGLEFTGSIAQEEPTEGDDVKAQPRAGRRNKKTAQPADTEAAGLLN